MMECDCGCTVAAARVGAAEGVFSLDEQASTPTPQAAQPGQAAGGAAATASTTELEWLEESKDEYGRLAATTIPYSRRPPTDPDQLVFDGPCPRCPHSFVYVWPLTVVRAAGPGMRKTTTVLVRCECEGTHANRPPEKKRGCGAFWTVEVNE